MAFGTEKDAAIYLALGKVAWKTPLKVRLKLRQTNASGKTSFLFGLALTDTGADRTQEISASPNPGYFGTSGFYDGATVGVKGTVLNGDTAPQTLEIAFDPAANSVTLRKDGVEVFRGSNRMEMSRVNRLTLKSGGTLTWLVDDVRVEFTPEDYDAMIAAGLNYFGLVRGIEPSLRSRPVLYRRGPEGEPPLAWPVDFYRSNWPGSPARCPAPRSSCSPRARNAACWAPRPGYASPCGRWRAPWPC